MSVETDFERIRFLNEENKRLKEENRKLRKVNDEIKRETMTVFDRLKECDEGEVAHAIAHKLKVIAPIVLIDWFKSHDSIDTTWFD